MKGLGVGGALLVRPGPGSGVGGGAECRRGCVGGLKLTFLRVAPVLEEWPA